MHSQSSDTTLPHGLSIEDGRGEELLGDKSEQVVVATDSRGNSLTLLEELNRRKQKKVSFAELAISACCAAASLAFAALIYFNTQ